MCGAEKEAENAAARKRAGAVKASQPQTVEYHFSAAGNYHLVRYRFT